VSTTTTFVVAQVDSVAGTNIVSFQGQQAGATVAVSLRVSHPSGTRAGFDGDYLGMQITSGLVTARAVVGLTETIDLTTATSIDVEQGLITAVSYPP
jgi:hypothetical protein